MKKEKNSINIAINGKDETKSQIVYNNVINNMEKMSLTKDEQLEYLKTRLTTLENDQKNKLRLAVIILVFTILLFFGLFLIIEDFHTFGVILSLLTFFGVIFTIIKFSKYTKTEITDKFEEIETVRKLLNAKLK